MKLKFATGAGSCDPGMLAQKPDVIFPTAVKRTELAKLKDA
jgi:hypothetical protein